MVNNAKALSKPFKNRPQQPLETAIYWIEYVIENGGHLLQPHSVHMNWIAYYSLDSIVFLIITISSIIYFLLKCCLAMKMYKKSSNKVKKN